jgi:hypothetical protein
MEAAIAVKCQRRERHHLGALPIISSHQAGLAVQVNDRPWSMRGLTRAIGHSLYVACKDELTRAPNI